MCGRKTFAVLIFLLIFCFVGNCTADKLETDWNDFLHYVKIGRLDLAKGYGSAVIQANPDPVKILDLSEQNAQGYQILIRVTQTSSDTELVELCRKILDMVEEGKFIRRADPKVILAEIKRLSGTSRGQLAAVKRLRNAGEYAVPFMLEALADDSRKQEWPNVIWALPQIGRDAIRPLAAAMQTTDVGIKAEIIKALGKIGYSQSLAYLKFVVEKDSSSELRVASEQSILQIDPAALKQSAALLFYRLGESYYYHAQSLAPAEDTALSNIWFWDPQSRRLFREQVDSAYFYELMTMRCCEWALKADPAAGEAIALWLAAFFKAESTGLDMPGYFQKGHADAFVYATTAGPEYLHLALARALADGDSYVALGCIESLGTVAGEKSVMYQVGAVSPLLKAMSFNNKAVRYSAAIAVAAAGPQQDFAEKKLVAQLLAQALVEPESKQTDQLNAWVKQDYPLRSVLAMLKLAQSRNPVIDLAGARLALIEAAKGKDPQIRTLAAQVLAYLPGTEAQKAIAAMSLNPNNSMDIRLSAFDALVLSAKLNANQLDSGLIDSVYSLVSDKDADPKLRSAAAGAFGALNLPSEKVKNLILDQAKS